MNIVEELFICKRECLRIKGIQYLPVDFNENKKYPLIIVSHGFTGNYKSTEVYCKAFARMGYIAVSFSFCGGGKLVEDESQKSDGATTEMTIQTEMKDLIAVKDYMKSKPYVNQEQIILVGISQGGLVSGLVAAKCKGEIAKLIMICPALCIPDHARRGCLGGANYNPKNVPEVINCGKTILGRTFHDEVVKMEPCLELAAYKGQVLILHGLEDQTVHYSYVLHAKESYEDGQCHLQLIRNAGHGFDEKQTESMIASIKQFLNNREEILGIRVMITHKESQEDGNYKKVNIYFTGYCESKYFRGTIMPEGCDTQEYDLDTITKIRAEYTLIGTDTIGQKCFIHIINQRVGEEWKPMIKTDSTVLAWLNDADLTAVLEGGEGGSTVRIFADRDRV